MRLHQTLLYITLFYLLIFLLAPVGLAAHRIVDLNVGYKTVNFTGEPARAIAVNDQIPGPTLHFKEGDEVTINVYNHLDQGTSMHWHGVLVPWQMDGVEGVTQQAIPPGGVFHYRFTIKQSGTYWYHAHSDFQEQEGVYGAMVIEPEHQTVQVDKDMTIVLSDWINEDIKQVFANLKKSGDFYSSKFPMQPSLLGYFKDENAAKSPMGKQMMSNAYHMMENMRMSIYDLSDVAYDAFLLNGKTIEDPWTSLVRVGDTVRLRFIDAGASTIFHIKIPDTKMQVIAVDGNLIQPYTVNTLSMSPGETYDVLVKIKEARPYIIYAESNDHLGAAVGALLTQEDQPVDYQAVTPFPKPQPVMMMGEKQHHMSSKGTQSSQKAQMKSTASLLMSTKYDVLQSPVKTNNPKVSIETIHMTLGGYMDRYIWFLNGKPFYDAKPIMIQHGHWYRLVFTNKTMMHHPMHIHGHWFILRNGHGAYDPKLHTIDVPPGKTVIADFYAGESGQWFFHCHNLIHMKAGMANIFRYKDTPTEAFKLLSGDKRVRWYFANNIDLNADFFNHTYEGTLNARFGSDYNKLQIYSRDLEVENNRLASANADVFYWRLLSQFWAVKGGLNYVYQPAGSPYIQPGIGLEGLLPYFIETDLRAYYHGGSAKLDVDISRNTQLTHRIFLRTGVEVIIASKTVTDDEVGAGPNALQWVVQPSYRVNPNVSIYLEYQRTDYFGANKRLLNAVSEATAENNYSVGIEVLF